MIERIPFVSAAAKTQIARSSILFSRSTRRRLVFALLGSIGMAMLEIVGLAVVLPLMNLLTGASTTSGALGSISAFFGHPSRRQLGIILAVIVIGSFILKNVAMLGYRWWVTGFLLRQEATTSARMLHRMLARPYWVHLERSVGENMRAVNDATSQVYSNLIVGLISCATEIINSLGIILILLVLQTIPALIAAVYFGVASFIFMRLTRSGTIKTGQALMAKSRTIYRAAIDPLTSVREIKVTRKAEYFSNRFAKERTEQAGLKRKSGFYSELPRFVFEVLFMIGIAVMTIAVFAHSGSKQAVLVVTLFAAAGSQLMPSIVRCFGSVASVRTGLSGLDIVLDELEREEEDVDDPDPTKRLGLNDRLELKDVSFSYRSSTEPVVRHVNLMVEKGSSLALVGTSGAGKSTLVDLILGLHEPSGGQIVVDGTPINEDLPSWQRSIGLVSQDVTLLNSSLLRNIAFGQDDADIDRTRLDEAVHLAQLEELIASLPEGLDTEVAERGARLSGGQRQRVAIARALYTVPDLLVLDEATSALDNEVEYELTRTIDSLHGSMTIIVIAHRLSTVRNCSRIAYLEQGEVVATGTFDELRRTNAAFAHLVELAEMGHDDEADLPLLG